MKRAFQKATGRALPWLPRLPPTLIHSGFYGNIVSARQRPPSEDLRDSEVTSGRRRMMETKDPTIGIKPHLASNPFDELRKIYRSLAFFR